MTDTEVKVMVAEVLGDAAEVVRVDGLNVTLATGIGVKVLDLERALRLKTGKCWYVFVEPRRFTGNSA